jgi:S1-C subfamily serine protease
VGQTVTQGIVSATGRNRLGINTFENFIQTDAAINPGNSGGALIDARGNLVGINTAIFSQSGGSQGIGFAIPVSLARQVFSQIIEKGRVDRGWLGVSARDVAETATRGALIMGVQRGGPAERAGIRAGDLIVSVNGKLISDTGALINETAVLAPGTRATFSVLRDGKTLSIPVELGRRPPPARTGQTLPR